LIEEATGEETRLGATDPNKDDRAVTPGSMSYALQTGKAYSISVTDTIGRPAGEFYKYKTPNSVAARYLNSAISTQIAFMTIASGHSAPIVNAEGDNSIVNDGTLIALRGQANSTGSGTNIGVYGQAYGATTNWAGYFDGNVAAGPITTLSDATLKENVEAIDPVKALQFRNGLQQKSYEMFTEQQVEITEEVTKEVAKVDAEGNPVLDADGNQVMETVTTQVGTGRYKVERNSQGFDFGYIAQDVKALTEQIGAFQSVVSEVGEYFTLDAQGYPVKDAQGNKIVNKRLGLNYSAMNIIIAAAEQYDSSVSMRQARLALLKFSLLDKVEAAVAGAEKAIQIDWEFAQSVNRNYGSVTTLAKAMGISDKQLDELFALARTL
jgi:hypothetical protein